MSPEVSSGKLRVLCQRGGGLGGHMHVQSDVTFAQLGTQKKVSLPLIGQEFKIADGPVIGQEFKIADGPVIGQEFKIADGPVIGQEVKMAEGKAAI